MSSLDSVFFTSSANVRTDSSDAKSSILRTTCLLPVFFLTSDSAVSPRLLLRQAMITLAPKMNLYTCTSCPTGMYLNKRRGYLVYINDAEISRNTDTVHVECNFLSLKVNNISPYEFSSRYSNIVLSILGFVGKWRGVHVSLL